MFKNRIKKVLVFDVIVVSLLLLFGSIGTFAEDTSVVDEYNYDLYVGKIIESGTLVDSYSNVSLVYYYEGNSYTEKSIRADSFVVDDGINHDVKYWQVIEMQVRSGSMQFLALKAVKLNSYGVKPADQVGKKEVANFEALALCEGCDSDDLQFEWYLYKEEAVDVYPTNISDYNINEDRSFDAYVNPWSSHILDFNRVLPKKSKVSIELKDNSSGVNVLENYGNLGKNNFILDRDIDSIYVWGHIYNFKVVIPTYESTGIETNILTVSEKENSQYFINGNQFVCRITDCDGNTVETDPVQLKVANEDYLNPANIPKKDNAIIKNPKTFFTGYIVLFVIFIGSVVTYSVNKHKGLD